jgi:acetyltransferase-like isoleucine patch superfamily enzyme
MPHAVESLLEEIEAALNAGPDADAAARILSLMGLGGIGPEMLEEIRLWADHLPKSAELPFSPRERLLQFLWAAVDKSPLCTAVNFSIPFRRAIARRLFKSCGVQFIAEEGCTFNFGNNISIGDGVLFNRYCYFDSKGGLAVGHHAGIGEFVRIYTHTHSESDHMARTYAPVTLGDFSKIYEGAVILPGVTVGEGAIVAAESVVNKNVPPYKVVAGIPAKVMRERRTDGRQKDGLDHYWLKDRAYQRRKRHSPIATD